MAKRKQQEQSGGGLPAWMGTYGDMVTLLLCFFVLLFSMSTINQEKFQKVMEYFAGQGDFLNDVLPGGEAITGGELIVNGTVQLENIQAVIDETATSLDTNSAETDTKTEEDTMSEEEKEELKKLQVAKTMAENIKEQLDADDLEAEIRVSYSPNYVKLTLRGEYLFDSGKAELKPDAIQAIKMISAIFKESKYNNFDIQVEGHTDNRPINTGFYKSNRYLSAARAIAVEEELVNVHGFIPQKVSSTGYGEFHPIDTNATVEGRAHNRRVEIKLLLKTEEKTLEEQDLTP